MKKIQFFLIAACLAVLSCTKDKTDYEAEIDTVVPAYDEFEEAVAIRSGGYYIRVEALNGTFYTGYNEIRVMVTNGQTSEKANASTVTFRPVRTDVDGSNTSCPHRYDLVEKPDDNRWSGYSVFTSDSGADGGWELHISFTVAGQTHTARQRIVVEEQTNRNLNMTAFSGKDDEQYIIALVSPQRPKVGENELVAGIYRLDSQRHSYMEADGYSLQLDPRMPEPSMGNHSSPNNKDLTQQSDGLYHGVVNYTMTGNWTLNFILLNPQGKILKGTQVPTDFTPGVEGVKSELHIDILF